LPGSSGGGPAAGSMPEPLAQWVSRVLRGRLRRMTLPDPGCDGVVVATLGAAVSPPSDVAT